MNGEQPSTSLQAKEHHLQYILTCYILILLPIYYSSHSLYKLTVAIIKELTNFLYLYVHCCTVFCPCTTDNLVYQLHVVTLPVVPCIWPASSESVTDSLSCPVLPRTADAHGPAGGSVGVLTGHRVQVPGKK